MSFFILFFGIFLSVAIRVLFILHGSDTADISKLHQIAEVILKGNNPYQVFDFTPYPPIGYYIEAATLFLSNLFSIPFHILTKILPNLADIMTTLILYKFLINQGVKPIKASFWSLIFILNPISIIISSAHGQFDSIPSLLVLLAIYILTFRSTKPYYLWSALLLGLAIAIKPNPAMLLPLFLVYNSGKLKQKFLFLSVSLTPMIISLAPYMWQSSREIMANVFGYSGVNDFGYAAIFRGFWYQKNANFWLPLTSQLLDVSKFLFLAGGVFLITLFFKSKHLTKACLAIYLLFLSVYFGISAQYLSWVLPLAILEKELLIIPFSLTGLVALIGFYMFFGPEILLGTLSMTTAFQSKYMLIYVIGNLTLWLTTLWWLIKIAKNTFYTNINTFTSQRKKFLLASLIIFVIMLFPTILLTLNLIQQLIR